jgi:hypothetical protein
LIAVHIKYSAFYAGLGSSDRARGLVEYFLGSRVMAVALPVIVYGLVVLWREHRASAITLGT